MAAAAAAGEHGRERAIDAPAGRLPGESAGGRERERIGRILEAAVTLAAALVIVAPLFPPLGLTPNRDSGVFLYTAQRMLLGEAPYRDVWDHKPPLVYLFNLAAVSTGQPLWGLWVLAAAWVGAAAWLLWSQLRASFGRTPARWGMAAALMLLAATYKGNLPEEYALLLQAVAVWGFARLASGRSTHPRLTGAGIGMLGALALLLKPTLVGLWLAMAITALSAPGEGSSRRRTLGILLAGLAGGVLVLAVAAAALAARGVWPEFWSSAVAYNVVYAVGGDRAARWSESLGKLGPAGMLALGGVVLLYAAGLLAWRRFRRRLTEAALAPGGLALALLPVIDLPIEALLSAGSGRLYLQYLTPWFPAVALLAASAAKAWLPSGLRGRCERWAAAVPALGLAAVIGLTAAKLGPRRAEAEQVRLAVEAVARLTTADSTVLVWGAETQVLALARRQAPSRYTYLYPLITVGYADAGRLEEFADDLRSDPPALVIDTSATNPVVPPLDPGRRASWSSPDSQYEPPEPLQSVVDWLRAKYHRIDPIGAWEVYAPNAR